MGVLYRDHRPILERLRWSLGRSSGLNRRHMFWAWCSLVSVGFSDLYVRLCSMGVWLDVRIW